MQDETKKTLKQLAKKADVSTDRVEQKYEEAYEKVEAGYAGGEDESTLEGHAVSIVRNEILNITGGSYGGGESEELPILTLGYQEKESDYFVTDEDALLALGIINPDEDPAGVAMFIVDSEDGVDLEHAKDAFEPLNTVRGYASRRQVGSRDGEQKIRKGGNPTYLCNTTGESKFEQVNPGDLPDDDPLSELPADREPKREMIHEHFITGEDHADLQTVTDHLTEENENGYPVAFGVDIKRFRGQVVDVYSNDDGFGVMTLLDETVTDETEVNDDLVTEQMRTPGLQVWGMPPELLKYGENSLVDVYGYIDQSQDGQVRLNGFGAVPIVEFEREFGNGGSSSDDDDIDEDTI